MRGTAGQGGSRPAPLAHKSQPCLAQVDKEPCDAAAGERVAGRVKVHREITLQGVRPSLLGEQCPGADPRGSHGTLAWMLAQVLGAL